ncbi:Cinnamoyl-CoA reductase 1 [Morella rubra]|uniref:Cinnamoyl-CoA reductase 1 n=1 Tax=Morella rubra TaxID=262757 RepID=A0A6A1WME0_9ROSI|nr:Cinnamoyl-CoA reductase 1 [Morella rubra]
MVMINPSMGIGPLLQLTLNISAAIILSLLKDDPKRTNHLVELDGAKERLHLFKANLLEESSFDAAIQGCDGVFHTASPFYNDVKDPQAELLDPAVKGTLNVLKSCAKSPSVKRVVLTSSIAAVAYNGRPRTPDVVVDETWFLIPRFARQLRYAALLLLRRQYLDDFALNDLVHFKISMFFQVIMTGAQWYVVSKTLAEEAAWKFSKEEGLDMVAINPAMVIGPLLQPMLNTSAGVISNLANGAQVFPNLSFGWVNVKDVANAHIQAYEMPSASGRYCLVERVAHSSEIVRILRELYPSLQLPDKCADDKPFVPTYQVSKERAKTLGIEYIPLEMSLKETVESLKEKNFVSF